MDDDEIRREPPEGRYNHRSSKVNHGNNAPISSSQGEFGQGYRVGQGRGHHQSYYRGRLRATSQAGGTVADAGGRFGSAEAREPALNDDSSGSTGGGSSGGQPFNVAQRGRGWARGGRVCRRAMDGGGRGGFHPPVFLHRPPPPPPPRMKGDYCQPQSYQSSSQGGDDSSHRQQPLSSPVTASADVDRYWRKIESAVTSPSPSAFSTLAVDGSENSIRTWKQTWAAAAAGARGPLEPLLTALMQIPKRPSAMPPTSDILRVMTRAVERISPATACTADLLLLERCLDVVNKRLQGSESSSTSSQQSSLSAEIARQLSDNLRRKASELLPRFSDAGLMNRCASLLLRVQQVMEPYINALQRGARDDALRASLIVIRSAGSEAPAWAGWRQPSMQWLLDGAWLQKVPDLCSSYNSTADYAEALHRLMVLLTFYWGAGAVWPRCQQRPDNGRDGTDSCCGEPLLLSLTGGGQRERRCTSRLERRGRCENRAAWACPRRRHEDAICISCLAKKQAVLTGSSGRDASTDIYDAVVDEEISRWEGQVYYRLSAVQSRRPPRVAPNWKTSYRLKCSALVAVVPLGSSQEALAPPLRISWAEIVPAGMSRPGQKAGGLDWDWEERAAGRMAVQLLRCDEHGHIRHSFDSSLIKGSRVAVIDLRVFVPEVVPVLSACADQRLPRHLDAIPFSKQLIGKGKTLPAFPPSLAEDPVENAIAQAIKSSDIELVQRLSPPVRNQLVADISRLARKANLYGTQLDAFAQALQASIHCTQGPPGTGKSYLGVQLILALDLIRNAAIREGHAVGPILTLSYKNHALDQIMLDIIKHADTPSFRQPRAFVRCGMAEDPKLKDHTEQRTREEKRAQDVLSERLMVTQAADCLAGALKDLASHVEPCAQELAHIIAEKAGAEDEQAKAQVLAKWLPENGDDANQGGMKHLISQVSRIVFLLGALCDRLAKAAPLLEEEHLSDEGDVFLSRTAGGEEEAFHLLELLCCDDRVSKHNNLLADTALLPLCGLSSNQEHWSEYQQFRGPAERCIYLLHVWLAGAVPPPRCLAVDAEGTRCMMQARNDGTSVYCQELHDCHHPEGCGLLRAEFPEQIMLCQQHRCKESTLRCLRLQLPGSSFCSRHSCPLCVKAKVDPIGERLPHSCRAHQCRAAECRHLQLSLSFQFCRAHACALCWEGDWLDKEAVQGAKLCRSHMCRARGCNLPVLSAPARDMRSDVPSPSSSPPALSPRQQYCPRHACTACEGVKAMVDPGSRRGLCSVHRCSHLLEASGLEKCQAQRVAGSMFCKPHTCRICMEQQLPLVAGVTDLPPRNVCQVHQLCCFMSKKGADCMNLAVQGTYYCRDHTPVSWGLFLAQRCLDPAREPRGSSSTAAFEEVRQTCHGITTRGKPCKAKGFAPPESKFYCGPHAAQASDSSSQGDENNDSFSEFSFADEDAALQAALQNSLQGEVPATAWPEDSWYFGQGEFNDDWEKVPGAQAPEGAAYYGQAGGAGGAGPSHQPDRPFGNSVVPVLVPPPPPSPPPPEVPGNNDVHCQPDAEAVAGREPLGEAEGPRGNETDELEGQAAEEFLDMDVVDTMPEAMEGRVHPDEMMLSDDDDGESFRDALNVNEEQERLREVLDEEDEQFLPASDGAQHGADDLSRCRISSRAELNDFLSEVQAWGWDVPVSERWLAAGSCLRKGASLVAQLCHLSEGHVEDARQELSAASATALRQARVIGVTVVGAARRLEALRAAEPFAMVVEEACEVMEPTLMAVVAVGSLRKLELVGDHYQLPAFVQNCWFNIETSHPSIKVSLFERLVTTAGTSAGGKRAPGAAGGEGLAEEPWVLCSVLDEQRRMRSAIADLTRGEYSNLVVIQDHPSTARRLIGDSIVADLRLKEEKVELQETRRLWEGGGALVPGVLPQQFFWDLAGNAEGRPVAGLSACNYIEAAAAARLAAWLVLCGVPEAAISIITPYKGQKMAIIKELRHLSRSLAEKTIVSTVDRYQGDENDVVILSLVRTRPGNRFVALKNRFIVAASRARIGFYILGSVGAVVGRAGAASQHSGPPHWRGLLENLNRAHNSKDEEEAAGDKVAVRATDEAVAAGSQAAQPTSAMFMGPRTGGSLPICCPQHAAVQRRIVQSSAFPEESTWDTFCSQTCGQALPWCGHQCGLSCHAPKPNLHKPPSECPQLLERPCEEHRHIPLSCGDLYRSMVESGSRWLHQAPGKALQSYKCKEIVDFQRPECDHSVKIPCHQHKKVVASLEVLPPCETKVADFIHPICNHRIRSPRCVDRRTWENSPPRCSVIVTHTRPCNHSKKMSCYEAAEEASHPRPCLADVEMRRPRCTHQLSLRCNAASSLKEAWAQHSAMGAVRAEASDPSSVTVEHGAVYGPSETQLAKEAGLHSIPECCLKVRYRLPCGHVIADIPCATAFRSAADEGSNMKCPSAVRFSSPLCGHSVQLPCWATAGGPWETFRSPVVEKPPSMHQKEEDGQPIVLESVLASLSGEALPKDLFNEMRLCCDRHVKIERLCGHYTPVPCARLVAIIEGKQRLPRCKDEVARRLACGHDATVPCHKKDADPPPVCRVAVGDLFTYPCGEHSVPAGTCHRLQELEAMDSPLCPHKVVCRRFRCSHEVSVACHQAAAVRAPQRGQRLGANKVVEAGVGYADAITSLAACQEPVTFQHSSCGHQVRGVPCFQAFAWAADEPQCQDEVTIHSPFCDHELRLQCSDAEKLQLWEPWGPNGRGLDKLTVGFDTTGGAITSPLVSKETPALAPLPAGLSPGILQCGGTCQVERPCGHTCTAACADALDVLGKPCQEKVAVVCKDCGASSKTTCAEMQQQAASGRPHLCTNKVLKVCSICEINKSRVECYRQDARCQQEVKAKRDCGHVVSWCCGDDEDPRKPGGPQCLHCLLPQWDKVLEEAAADQGKQLPTQQELLAHALGALPREVEVLEVQEAAGLDLQRLMQAWGVIVRNYRDHLATCCESQDEMETARSPPRLSDLANYDAVFAPSKSPEQQAADAKGDTFQIKQSPYGRGAALRLVTAQGLKRLCKPTDEGVVKIYLGVAFRSVGLVDVPPFASRKSRQHQIGKTNHRAAQLQSCGFDHVVPTDSTEELPLRIYWVPGAALPLASVSLRIHCPCSICFEQKLIEEGCRCPSGHFTCWDCFQSLLEMANQPDATRRQVDGAGNLCCPEVGCEAVYHMHHVASQTGQGEQQEAVFAALVELRNAARLKAVLPQAVADERERLTAEFRRIQAITDLDERAAAVLRMEIIEEILTLKCPACRKAFHDFDGCFALTCSDASCGAGFCAWCLKHCGRDAHSHVAACPESRRAGEFYSSLEDFHDHHRRRKGRLIGERLRQEKPAVRGMTLRLLEPDLTMPDGKKIVVQ